MDEERAPSPPTRHRIEPPAATRICFRYRPPGRRVSLFDVQIVIDASGVARRIEIRRASAIADELPPLSRGRLSAGRLRAAVDLLGLIERMIQARKTNYAPGALVSVLHLQRLRRPRRKHWIPKPDPVRRNPQPQSGASRNGATKTATPYGRARIPRESMAMGLSRTTILFPRARIRYPLRRV